MASPCKKPVNDARRCSTSIAKAGVMRPALPRPPARARCVSAKSIMRVGLPKEIKNREYRVGMTPANVATLNEAGHEVYVEAGAGEGSGFADSEYVAAGARMCASHADVFESSEMIVKIKEPIASEYPLIKRHHLVFTYFHFASCPELYVAMKDSGATCIAYECVEKADGSLPLLVPMSEVAGCLSVQMGMRFLEKTFGGSGVLLGGVAGVAPGVVTVFGAGNVGINATRTAAGLGASVYLLDSNLQRLRTLALSLPKNVITIAATPENVDKYLMLADVAVGATLVAGARTKTLITRQQLERMKPGSVFVDVSVDQGGVTEVTRPTTHDAPTYKVGGTTMYCVANMPGCVPRTSTHAITNATLPYTLELCAGGTTALLQNPELLKGLSLTRGTCTYKALADQFRDEYVEPRVALLHASAGRSGGEAAQSGEFGSGKTLILP